MQPRTYLYCFGIYVFIMDLTQMCKDSCAPYAFCSNLIATTSHTTQFHFTIAAYLFVLSSCRIINSHTHWLSTSDNCADLAWSAAGGTYILDSYLRGHPGTLTRWVKGAKSAAQCNSCGGGSQRRAIHGVQLDAGEASLEL